MYQLLFFIISLRYFVDHDLNSWSGILLFFLIKNSNFLNNLVYTDICQEIDETESKMETL